MLLQLFIFLGLFALTGFFLLRLFGKLVKLNMFSVMNWAFRSGSESRKSIVLLPFGAVFCFLIAFLLLYSCFYLVPKRISYIDENNAGGLLGYNKDLNHMVYDPSAGKYVGYFWYDAPYPATKFTETFEIVSFYKLPSKKYYQSIASLGWGKSLALLITGMLFLTGTYFILFLISRQFVTCHQLPDNITHSSISGHFRSFVRISPMTAMVIFIILALLFPAWNYFSVKKVKNHYHSLYAADQDNLRNELLSAVSTGDTLEGMVLSGYRFSDTQTERIYEEGVEKPSRQTTYQTGFIYVVEFKDLLPIPVYLTLSSPVALGNVIEAGKYKGDKEKIIPDFLKEYAFIVNQDYSVSLVRDSIN